MSNYGIRSLPIYVQLRKEELDNLRYMQIRFRRDWPATFSANCLGHIWAFNTYEYTPEELRLQLRGASALLDYLADEYLDIRPEGGRFFVDDNGSYYRDEANHHVQFAKFCFVTDPRRQAAKPLGPGRTQEQQERHDDRVCDENRCPFCTDKRLRGLGVYQIPG